MCMKTSENRNTGVKQSHIGEKRPILRLLYQWKVRLTYNHVYSLLHVSKDTICQK